ncbi:MAG: hypothetical protein CMJ21_02985 [Phycisphaerae bacterium]|nr:hypothetical protein [Phycisphaerae bacterium]
MVAPAVVAPARVTSSQRNKQPRREPGRVRVQYVALLTPRRHISPPAPGRTSAAVAGSGMGAGIEVHQEAGTRRLA